jgi:cell division protease FtsH
MQPARLALVLLAGLLLAAFVGNIVRSTGGSSTSMTYGQLVQQVETAPQTIDKVVFKPRGQEIDVELADGSSAKVNYPTAEAQIQLQNSLEEKNVAFDSEGTGTSVLGQLLSFLLPLVIIAALLIFFLRRSQAGARGAFSFGKSRARRVSPDAPKVTFKDVAGADEAVEELHEIKEFLASPAKFRALGARIPKGVLLAGPPGTGKTLLARAVAGEAGAPFFSISGSDFVEMFVGVGASRVRDLFNQAKATAPAIVFIDEIDAVGRHRGAGLGGGHDEREQTLNQLLVEMDGFEANDTVIVIAATNRPDVLDPALLRPGRFDRQIVVDRPDRAGRRAILGVHTKGKPLAGVDLDSLAAGTPGFTGADLANLVNEGALLSARRGLKAVGMRELEEGILRAIAGPEKKTRLISEGERAVTAYHEMGHALVGHFLPNSDPVHKISIIGRGRALGFTLSLPREDKFLQTKSALLDRMAMTLGGRAAEELVFGEITTGAADDLQRVTDIAKQMVMRLGMSEKLGPRVLGRDSSMPFLGRDLGSEPDYSDDVAREIDEEVRRLIDDAYQRAHTLLVEHTDDLNRLSRVLIEQETIDKDQFERLLAGESPDSVFPPPPPPDPEDGGAEPDRGKARRPPALRPQPFPLPGALAHAREREQEPPTRSDRSEL